jgi:predicted dehydrogenase
MAANVLPVHTFSSMNFNRRRFLKSAAMASVAAPAALWSKVPGANEDIRVAVVGFNSRGQDHIDNFRKLKGVRVVALCDVDRTVLDQTASKLAAEGNPVATFTDVRKLLEQPDIDAISTATPNHWHALISVWACQHGKDVYVEKPVSHSVWEGRQIVKAARKHHRIVQTGTQSRSSPALQEAVAWLKEGKLGKIQFARGLCYKPRQSIGRVSSPTRVPDTIDYDLWCGPTPLLPLFRKRLHYDWHWVYQNGNGDVGNQGIHQMDIARWFLGERRISNGVLSVGGRLGYFDDGDTPNSQIVIHDYDTAPLIFEVRGLPKSKIFQAPELWTKNMPEYHHTQIGVVISYEEGIVVIPSSYNEVVIQDNRGNEIKRFQGSGNHYLNFIQSVRSRRRSDLNADIEEGHVSSALCHLGNISHRLGEKLGPPALRERLKNNEVATEALGRLMEHLEANEVDLIRNPLTLGALLEIDSVNELFYDNAPANHLLREYGRPPFVVPEIA